MNFDLGPAARMRRLALRVSAGERPPSSDIARALRSSEPLPREVVEYIVEHRLSEPPGPVGRPRKTTPQLMMSEHKGYRIIDRVRRWQHVLKHRYGLRGGARGRAHWPSISERMSKLGITVPMAAQEGAFLIVAKERTCEPSTIRELVQSGRLMAKLRARIDESCAAAGTTIRMIEKNTE